VVTFISGYRGELISLVGRKINIMLNSSQDRRKACTLMLANFLFTGANSQSSRLQETSYFVLGKEFELTSLHVDKPEVNDLLEAQIVLEKKKLRTPKLISEIRRQDTELIAVFVDELSASRSDKVMFKERLALVLSDTADVVIHFKKIFNRPRPSELLPNINPVLNVPLHRAYPSGHATQAIVAARMLIEWTGLQNAQLEKLATRVGRNREIAGLHFPSDTVAGFNLGSQLVEYFKKGNL